MPSADYTTPLAGEANIVGGDARARTRATRPLVNSGSLEGYKHFDLTPVIGREFEGLQVIELLKADEQLLRDLAITGQ